MKDDRVDEMYVFSFYSDIVNRKEIADLIEVCQGNFSYMKQTHIFIIFEYLHYGTILHNFREQFKKCKYVLSKNVTKKQINIPTRQLTLYYVPFGQISNYLGFIQNALQAPELLRLVWVTYYY